MNSIRTEQNTGNHASSDASIGAGKAIRQEYLDGIPLPKPASDRRYNLIASNLASSIGSRVQKAICEVYVNDMQVRIGRNSICFPAFAAVNGEPEFADATEELLINPTVLVEIYSHSSRTADRTQKLEGFLAIPSLKECLLINKDEMRIEHYARQNAKQWIYRIYNEKDDVISFDSIGCKISLADLYAQVRVRGAQVSSKAIN